MADDFAQSLLDWIDSQPDLPEEEHERRCRQCFPPPRPFGLQHWTFDVLDGGAWYRIDAAVPESAFYNDVPKYVQRRARAAIIAVIDAAIDAENGVCDAPTTILRDLDHTDGYEAILRAEFDDVRFVDTDYVPGVIW